MLIHGAGGGVGTFAVQLAAAAGARVVATGRAWARQITLRLGADRFIDVEHEGLDAVHDVNVVFDLVGGELLARSWPLVARGGAVVSAVEDSLEGSAREYGVRAVFFVVEADPAGLLDLARRIDGGELSPVVGRVLPLSQGREAFRVKQTGGVSGKVALVVE